MPETICAAILLALLALAAWPPREMPDDGHGN